MRTPVKTSDGRIIGYIVRVPSGSFFVQRKRVLRGACINIGINAHYMYGRQ